MAQHPRRQYLINSRFQLRWALLLAVVGGFIATLLTSFLWVSLDQQRTQLGELVLADQSVRNATEDIEVLLLNMPETSASEAKELRARFDGQLTRLEEGSRIRTEMMAGNTTLKGYLVGFVLFLIAVLFVWGIFVTHRIAGPLYVIKTQLAAFRLTGTIAQRTLRSGDEFKEVYDELMQALGKSAPTGGGK